MEITKIPFNLDPERHNLKVTRQSKATGRLNLLHLLSAWQQRNLAFYNWYSSHIFMYYCWLSVVRKSFDACFFSKKEKKSPIINLFFANERTFGYVVLL